MFLASLLLTTPGALSAAPASTASIDCGKPIEPIEETICASTSLAALDNKLVEIYASASKVATGEQRNRLAAEQQRWLEDRNRCSGSADRATCVKERYVIRIADLQAQFKLVASRGPFRFVCNKDPGNVLVAQYFETEPPAARFTYDGRGATAFIARSGSGSRYEGQNVSYWEHQGEASVVWFGRTMKCATR